MHIMSSNSSIQARLCCLFLLLSAGLVCSTLASSRDDVSRLFYVTPTQPPNPECPKYMSCQTLQYYMQHPETIRPINSNEHVTLMFLSGNHTVPPCRCSRFLYFSDYLSMVGLDGNIIIHNLLDTTFYIAQLSLKNIIFYNGKLTMTSVSFKHNIQLVHIDSVQLIECVLSISKAELGEIVRLWAQNSQVLITSSNNMIFTSCTFHDFDEIPWPTAYSLLISETPAVIVDQSHNIT